METVSKGWGLPTPPFYRKEMSKEAEILYEALNSEYGVEVEIIGNYQTSLQRLYKEKKQNIEFDILQISRSPTGPMHIWIVKTDRPDVTFSEPQEQVLKENPKGEGPLFSLADLLGDN
jgi:hypothetical protein